MAQLSQISPDAVSDDVAMQAADMEVALRGLKPKLQHRKNQLFSLLYPVIVELLAKNVTQKSILEALQAKGLKLHPARFKELMAAEGKGDGDVERSSQAPSVTQVGGANG
jgi:hypothetical protein